MDLSTDASVLGLAFGVWAIVVAYGVRVLQAMRGDVRHMSKELHDYIVRTETRLAVLEDRMDARRNKDVGRSD